MVLSSQVNVTEGNIAVCFKDHYRPGGTGNDCFLTAQRGSSAGRWSAQDSVESAGSDYHQNLPQIKAASGCSFNLQLGDQTNPAKINITFRKFGTQSAAQLVLDEGNRTALQADVQVEGEVVRRWNGSGYYLDTSGCRRSGVFYEPGTAACDSEASSITCDATSVLSTAACGPGERCHGNGQCTWMATCTATASTVIDLHGNVTSVPDRCAYTLLAEAGVQVLAVFRERRRLDVSFLDRVILRLDEQNVDIQLGQGGRVQLNDTDLILNGSPLQRHGVELLKDRTGVAAKILSSSFNTSVFFDGYTAQIHVMGSGDRPLQGLCGNSSRALSELRLYEFNSSSCETKHQEPDDRSISCTAVTERCNLLKEAPFAACHNLTDPEPFVTACINTLCKYPAVDDLRCQFHEAYARTCSLHSNRTLQGWRSEARCSSPQAFCQDTFCSDHEFCAKNIGGETSCFCRATFASKYRSANTLGEPTVCGQNAASVSLVGCLLEEKGIDYSELHLNNQSCTGQRDDQTHMVTFTFDRTNTCGTVVMANNSQIIYKNTIKTPNASSPDAIVRHEPVKIDFSCFYSQPDIKSMAFRIKDSSVIQQIVSGSWSYTLNMTAFTDAGRTHKITSSTEVRLEQTVWVELKTTGLEEGLVAVVTDSCWATSEPSANGSLRYDLIIAGCANPADETVQVEANGRGTSNHFSFKMFQFSGHSGDIYLHCKVKLCVNKSGSCSPSCGKSSRGRRSAELEPEDRNPAVITMSWSD
ncbi:uncharacterized protein LOC103368549 [Stegastes partitus]|uniref:Uncharacterized protein LOC103368549 n=1 Tax=Stegastes partitus TaxID=144197 RepID=A0A9Y4KPY1_9TELE|nr:PREDICTED: uncharacterized protein LOC103368549 [Stegastes partitus]